MKKLLFFLAILVLFSLPLITQAECDCAKKQTKGKTIIAATENDKANEGESDTLDTNVEPRYQGDTGSSDESEEGEQIQSQESATERTQERERLELSLQECNSRYEGRQEKTRTMLQSSSEITKSMMRLSYELENQELGEQIRTVARNQIRDDEAAAESLDDASKRNKVFKFLVGPNYKSLKEAKTIKEENQLRIRELARIQTQLENEGEAGELYNIIREMLTLNESLENQLREQINGFSLLGWFFKLIYKY